MINIIVLLILILIVLINYSSSNDSEFIQGKVTSINSDNISRFLNKQPSLLEFKATWCSHCQLFNILYEKIASDLPYFRVGAVDIDQNPAVVARYDVTAIPTIFLYKDNKVWKYEGPLQAQEVIDWATRGYQTKNPIPLYISPIGPMGVSKGILISLGNSFIKSLPFLTESLGLPDWAGFIIIASFIGFLILLVTFVFIYLGVQHAKID
jgi:thiol-disulfide isomerase/thioredoxin